PADYNLGVTIEGTIDSVEGTQIAGWAWDMNHPDDPVSVDIYQDDTLLASVLADEFRQDLLDAGKGNGRHAFFHTVSSLPEGEKVLRVRVKISGTDVELYSPETGGPSDLPTPPEGMIVTTGHPNAQDFAEAGRGSAYACKTYGKLRPDGSVLDV